MKSQVIDGKLKVEFSLIMSSQVESQEICDPGLYHVTQVHNTTLQHSYILTIALLNFHLNLDCVAWP